MSTSDDEARRARGRQSALDIAATTAARYPELRGAGVTPGISEGYDPEYVVRQAFTDGVVRAMAASGALDGPGGWHVVELTTINPVPRLLPDGTHTLDRGCTLITFETHRPLRGYTKSGEPIEGPHRIRVAVETVK